MEDRVGREEDVEEGEAVQKLVACRTWDLKIWGGILFHD
jgi:hypothetical protein